MTDHNSGPESESCAVVPETAQKSGYVTPAKRRVDDPAELQVPPFFADDVAGASRCHFCQHPRTPGDPCRDCYEDGMATR